MSGKKKTPKKQPGLNARQKRFVAEYVVDLHATNAATRAGYSEKTAGQIGYQLLQKTSVQEAIQAALKSRENRTQIKADRVLRELAWVAFSDLGEILDFEGDALRMRPGREIRRRARRALASMKVRRVFEGSGDDRVPVDVVEFKLWDKLSALTNLGRHLKLFTDKIELCGPDLDRAIARELERLAGTGQAETAGPAAAPG